MAIYPVDPTDVESFTVVTNPYRSYLSSSLQGATGSVYVFPRRSHSEKDARPDSAFVEPVLADDDYLSSFRAVQQVGKLIRNSTTVSATGTYGANFLSGNLIGVSYPQSGNPFIMPLDYSVVWPVLSGSDLVSGTIVVLSGGSGQTPSSGTFVFGPADLQPDFNALVSQYLDKVNAEPMARRKQQALDINRFSPPPVFNSNTVRKWNVQDILQPYYRTTYPTAHWSYTNYNTLNFFTASMVPTSSALLYPNIDGDPGGLSFCEGRCHGTYTPSGSFSFDFYINPRYTADQRDGSFRAGTILHLSSTYALSLVSGSSKDVNGRPVGFRLQLQLSHSADISPSRAMNGPYPADLVFLSDDNALWFNRWQHVVVRWGTQNINAGIGTFNVDGIDRGTFLVPSSTIVPLTYSGDQASPSVLCLGNFFEGPNHGDYAQANFFAADPATRDGLNQMIAQVGIEEPISHSFRHPLNAELHDVAIRRCYMSDFDIQSSASVGPVYLDNTFALYVPPFFVQESPYRQFVNDHGGIPITPFEEVDGASTSPFSVALSFGVAGHYINLENFVRDFASNNFPRLHHLTASVLTGTTDAETANEFLYSQPFVVKRNLTVLPCDDGLFVPSFQLLASETMDRAADDMGLSELSFIHLRHLVNTSTLMFGGSTADDGSDDSTGFTDAQVGGTPESPFAGTGPAVSNYANTVTSGSDVEAGAPLTVYQRTQDASSNQVTFFDLSNLYYGFRIMPKTLRLKDPDLIRSSFLGSQLPPSASFMGPIRLTLADDGRGNVYRADCFTSHSSWNSVGNVYYDEGVVVVKSPHAFFFGQDAYEVDIRGEQHVHVMKVNVVAPNNELNSSSNPGFRQVPLTDFPNDPEKDFVYITGINFHDTDLNVVMKSQLAQPIAKRHGDRLNFKIRYDF
jgi:hypothetical protein